MHIQFIPFLVDPETGADLRLESSTQHGEEIESGYLVSDTGRYPIINGIPRFVTFEEDNYSGSFGYQWNRQKWSRVQFESENVGKPMEGWTRGMWERITGFEEHRLDLNDKLILDIGCGPGRFIEVARSKGAKVIGLDYSSAVDAARDNFKNDPNVCIVQGDALNPPIRSGVIDGSFSIGVLHHTPDPKKGVEEAFLMLKENGWFAISVYAAGGYYSLHNVQFVRRAMKLLWRIFGPYPALVYTYLSVIILRPIDRRMPRLSRLLGNFIPHKPLPDLNWSLLDTFDSITPSYQSAHTSYEVFRWFKDIGFTDIEPTDWGFTAYFGRK